jgi:hypothetical protein
VSGKIGNPLVGTMEGRPELVSDQPSLNLASRKRRLVLQPLR